MSVSNVDSVVVCAAWRKGICHWGRTIRDQSEFSSLAHLSSRDEIKHLQIPFGYLSANEIDLQFQYRYANQASLHICSSIPSESS